MTLSNLSRCTGFPPAVLQSLATQGFLLLAKTASTTDAQNGKAFDGQTFLRTLVELKHAR
jgi:hypothetical protein